MRFVRIESDIGIYSEYICRLNVYAPVKIVYLFWAVRPRTTYTIFVNYWFYSFSRYNFLYVRFYIFIFFANSFSSFQAGTRIIGTKWIWKMKISPVPKNKWEWLQKVILQRRLWCGIRIVKKQFPECLPKIFGELCFSIIRLFFDFPFI